MKKLTTKYSYAICGKGVGVNSIQYRKYMKWMHKQCSRIKGNLAKIKMFECIICKSGYCRFSQKCKHDRKCN